MSTDPYPDVAGDESGIVPPQSGRSAEWPKKIRTLTASELDRLTIDGNGRFYWDGRLVNYEPPQPKEPEPRLPDARDRTAMEMLDRAAYELGDQKSAEPAAVEIDQSIDVPEHREELVQHEEHGVAPREEQSVVDFSPARSTVEVPLVAALAEPHLTAYPLRGVERIRLKLSFWQSLGAIIVVLGIMVGASGVAAYGLSVAHEWGCRTGLVNRYCPAPPPPAPQPPKRPDIPA